MKFPEKISARDLIKNGELTFTFKMVGVKRLLICLWISKQLIRLAAWIAGFGTTEFKEK